MRIGAFELQEPLPELRQPHLLVVLRPWIDVGSVGTLALTTLEGRFGAQELGRLVRPGEFYDFTRYRPPILRREGERHIITPNSVLRAAKGTGGHDWLFLHLLEPHNKGEDLMEAVGGIIDRFHVHRYGLVGAMYGAGPHTRPLLASGTVSEPQAQKTLERQGLRTSNYEGPTSIMALVTEEAQKKGVEVMSLLVQLPPYVRLEEDYKGQEALLRYLGALYRWDVDLAEIANLGAQQYAELDRAMQADRQMRGMVRRLEEAYDSEGAKEAPREGGSTLPQSVQEFLKDLGEEGDGRGA